MFGFGTARPLLPAGEPPSHRSRQRRGFPGLVLAILTDARVRLVESDARKCAFLLEAARAAGAQVKIDQWRSESLPPAALRCGYRARPWRRLPELLAHAL